MLQTDPITYNVNERGRQARGVDRHFDCAVLASIINGPSVQEKVRLGDMFGYFGHWPRIKFGMEPQEGGVVDGVAVSVEPALRTIELRADDQGNITHRVEFLDTAEGHKAQALYNSKAGGFSSAIDAVPGSAPMIPKGFYGFDYVLEPNYTTNRGHRAVLDAVAGRDPELLALFDQAIAESSQAATLLCGLLQALETQHLAVLDTLARLGRENDLLIGRLAQVRDAPEPGRTTPDARVLDSTKATQQPEDYRRFLTMPLVPLQQHEAEAPSPEVEATLRRFGMFLG
jgi:hypothetical protein